MNTDKLDAEERRMVSSLGAPKRPAVRWLGVIDPTGKPWNNTTYNACVGPAIQKCGQLFSGQQLADCIDNEQLKCIAQAKNAPASMSKAQVIALQTKINNALKQYNYCPIGVDGSLGPETCGAAIWAVTTDPSITVPAYCNGVKPSFQLKDCPGGGGGGGGGGGVVTPECGPNKACPPGQQCVDGKCQAVTPAPAPAKKSNLGLLLLGGGAALGAIFLGPALLGKGGSNIPKRPELAENSMRRRRR